MKKLKKIITLSTFVIIAIFIVWNTFSQEEVTKPEIFMQLKLYNIENQLIGYTEKIVAPYYFDEVIKWVEPRAKEEIITKNGKSFKILRFEDALNQSDSPILAAYYLTLPINDIVRVGLNFHFGSFYFEPEDKAKVFWTVTIPLD